jgi:pyroglutamyl-peptidase
VDRVLLVTGFGPWGVKRKLRAGNRSADVVKRLPAATGRYRIHQTIVPTALDAYRKILDEAAQIDPLGIVMLGEFAFRLRIERRARNVRGFGCPRPSVDGPRVLEMNAPSALGPMAAAARRLGVKARVTDNAQRYICNFTYYKVLAETERPSVFIHVPILRGPGIPSDGLLADAITAAIQTFGEHLYIADRTASQIPEGSRRDDTTRRHAPA